MEPMFGRPVLALDIDGTLLEAIHLQAYVSQSYSPFLITPWRTIIRWLTNNDLKENSLHQISMFSQRAPKKCRFESLFLSSSYCDTVSRIKVRLRPGLSAFLNRLRPEFELVIWTAAPLNYAEAMVEGISGMEDLGWFKDELIRVWSEEQTDVAWRGKPIITKKLQKLAEDLEVILLKIMRVM